MFIKLVLLLLLLPAMASADEAVIEGRVFSSAGPLQGARVKVFRTYDDISAGVSQLTSAPADKDGVYRFSLPPGAYYFVAEGEANGKRYFSYHGNNPVKVGDGKLWLALMGNEVSGEVVQLPGPTSIEGVIRYKGEPVSDAYVAIYAPGTRTFKGLGVKTESAGPDGRFNVSLEPGRYVVVAKMSPGAKSNRPLQKGDLYCYYPNNPLEVRTGQTARIELSCYPKADRGAFVDAPFIKDGDLQTVASMKAGSKTGIRGKVTDPDGNPVPGLSVMAYRTEAPVFMMYQVYHGTEYSAQTDASGSYFIPVDREGTYGIVARDILGDGPHRGELYGLYAGNPRHAVTLGKEELVDRINITVGRVMPAQVVKSTGGEKASSRPVVVGKAGGPPAIIGDTVITGEMVWQGEITVKGVVAVKRGASLTVTPGTTVKFVKMDRDGNEVGDGEIMVEGRLIAKGTKDKPIRFVSAEANPSINDWSYLQFIASDTGNLLEYCQFENAFAGVMIHYAEVRIVDCLFRNNNRGLHFNTADLHAEHNTFVDNRIGIRFMRFEGDILIKNNQIAGNDIGVLFVRQHVNAVNFDQLNKGTELPRFVSNNISGNLKYDFTLGDGQDRDVPVAGNWWGTAKADEISDRMYDKGKDGSLSRIIFEPHLQSPVSGAGMRN